MIFMYVGAKLASSVTVAGKYTSAKMLYFLVISSSILWPFTIVTQWNLYPIL